MSNSPSENDMPDEKIELEPELEVHDPEPKPAKSGKRVKRIKKPQNANTLPVTQQHAEPLTNILPPTFVQDMNTNPFTEFARSHFLVQKTGSLFSKKEIPLEVAIVFTTESITSPHLSSTPKNLAKQAVLMFKCIMKYCQVRPSKQSSGNLNEFIKFLPSLTDECYVQLIRQTSGAPEEALKAALQLFLILVSFYAPSAQLAPYARSHLAKITTIVPSSCNLLSHLCYVRLCTRIDSKTTEPPPTNLDAYLQEVETNQTCFGVSLYEMMLRQHSKLPRLQVPLVLHEMGEALIHKDCEKTPGIFRVVGNLNQLGPVMGKANKGEDYLAGLTVTDISSLFKEWCRDVPGGIINETHLDRLMQAKNSEEYISFANNLPLVPKNVLMYIVGFLRRLALSQDVTLMGVPNLAMVFALNVSFLGDESPGTISTISSMSAAFLQTLINSWDVTPVYPISEEVLH